MSSDHEPIYSTALVPAPSKPSSRRLPPPCWSDAETVALIDVYRDKWYSLRRGNLRAPDWQDVADGVADRCRSTSPAKTSIQCRHKMEKLRKRYRAEIQRIGGSRKGYRCPSSWIHFRLMEDMELGLNTSDLSENVNMNNQNDDVEDEIQNDDASAAAIDRRIVTGVRIKIPNFVAPCSKYRSSASASFDDLPPEYGSGSGKGFRNGYPKRKSGDDSGGDGDVMNEMVAAIQRLGDRFVRMERMKMEMARELESMRMKAEMRQTEMILETHRTMWESFSETVFEKKKKKMKRMGAPEEEA